MIRYFTIASAFVALGADAQEEATLTQEDQRGLTETINTFSRCAGVYEVTSEFYKATNQPATAEHVHNLANGAASAAMYLLGQENVIKDGPPRPYGDFMRYVDGLKETAMVAMRSALELGDTDGFLKRFKECAALVEAQE